MDDEENYVENYEEVDVEQVVYKEEEEELPVVDEESSEEESDNEEEKKEKKIKQKKIDLKEKYNMLVSKTKYPDTYNELVNGTSFFDLSIWQDCKVAEQTALEFETRKKETVKGLYVCKKCKGEEVYIVTVFLRSGDEAADIFASCINCRNVWKVG